MSSERENKVRQHLVNILSELFDVKEEVIGYWPFDNRKLRLDILLRPNAKARMLGFDVEAIGIEVKDPESKESTKKLLDCVMQAHSYTFCEFDGVRPAYVLIYPVVKDFFEHDWKCKYNYDSREQPTRREIRLLQRIMQRAKVGELFVDGNEYRFLFGGGPFFDSETGRSKIKGIGRNCYIGSQKFNK